MGNPNPFYRFKQGWNAGFYPDNQIMTDLLNEMVGQLTIDLPSIWPGKTIDGLYAAIQSWVEPYQKYPYYGIFNFSIQKIPDPPNNSEYNINIVNPDMFAAGLSGSSLITINGFFNPTSKIVFGANIEPFTPGAYSGAFARPLINEEIKVKEALGIVDINGSAIFPITYSFNPINNVATSGLARGDNWVLSDGVAQRQPVPNLPYENRRTFELPQLNGDDAYILSIMERIIAASLIETDYALGPQTEYNKYTMPDGWTKTASHPVWTTYERVQFNFKNGNRRKFILVGRLDGNWLWQRFVSDTSATPYNFLTAYSESTQMPYEVMQAGRWIYNDDTFDLEFVEFTSACYESPEFYPMPAKPGDQFQFNIVEGNLTGIDSFQIGLFKENGEFVQNIGQGVKSPLQYTGLGMYGFTGVRANYVEWYEIYNPVYPIKFQYIDCNGLPIGEVLAIIPANAITSNDFTDFKTIVEGLNWQDGISVIVTQDSSGFVEFNFTIDNPSGCFCGITAWTYFEGSGETVYFIKNEPYSQFIPPTQFQASVVIPSYKGCYRMGLYNGPSTSCDLTFTYTLAGSNLTAYLQTVNLTFESANPFLSFIIDSYAIYVYPITSGTTTAQDIADWCNSNIPGMTAVVGEGTLIFTWEVQDIPCGDSYAMRNCISQEAGNCLVSLWATSNLPCDCGNGSVLYSLSNIINIDSSECFSTMLEYWGDNNTIAQGYEYQNNWKQRIRIGLNGGGQKPVIEESVYRQSNGVHRRPQNKQDLSIDLHTDFFDLETQLAMTDATRHPYIVWNGQGIFVKGDLDVATIQDFTTETSFEQLAQMKFQVLKQGFQPKNSSCLNC